jgi:hypothetical protein
VGGPKNAGVPGSLVVEVSLRPVAFFEVQIKANIYLTNQMAER